MNATTAKSMNGREWGQLLLLGALWGASFFFIKVSVAEIEPLTLVFYRVAIAALALQIYLMLRGPGFRLALPHAGAFAVLAILNNVIPFSLIFLGETRIGAGLAAILNATTPFWTVIAASFLATDEKFTMNKLAGILLGIAGTAVMIGPGIVASLGAPVWAQLAILGAAVSYAFAAVFARRFRGLPSAVVATGQLTASTIVMAVVVVMLHGASSFIPASFGAWASVAALGILSTAFAYILYFNLIASAGATNASLVTLLVPVSAVLLGIIALGETFSWFEFAGMVLIGLGLLMIDGRILPGRQNA